MARKYKKNYMAIYAPSLQPKLSDLYETPTETLDMVLDHLDPVKHYIWEPFRGTGHSTRYMSEQRGFRVTNGDDPDFFQQTVPFREGMTTVLVSNPPFSLKQQILKHLFAKGFYNIALLLPAPVLFTKYFRAYCSVYPVQIIVHTKRCTFLDPSTGKKCGPASFDVVWICIGLSLPRDLIFPGLLPGALPSSA